MLAETPLFGRAAEVTIDTLKLVGFDVRLEVRYSGDTGGGDWAITSICSRY